MAVALDIRGNTEALMAEVVAAVGEADIPEASLETEVAMVTGPARVVEMLATALASPTTLMIMEYLGDLCR